MNQTPVIVAVLSPLVTLCVALWGFRRTTKADKLRMFLDLQERYLSPSARTGRRLIHQRLTALDPTTFDQLTEEERGHIHHTLAVMDTLAIAWEGGHVDRAIIGQAMGRSYATAIGKAQAYIDYQAAVRGFQPYQYARRLARELQRSAP